MQRRWHSLINIPIQLGILGLFVTGMFLVTMIFCSLLWYCLHLLYSSLILLTHDPLLLEHVQEIVWERASVVLGTLLIVVSIAGFLIIRLTNRIAGPIYRINQELQEMIRKGEAHEIRVREGDFFQDLVARLNRLLRLLDGDGGEDARPRHPA